MKKQTLILIPGLLCDAEVWLHQRKNLQMTPDIIVPDLSTAATPEEMVNAALNHAPDTFALAGHSMGGWIALEIMRVASERVSRLCLLNTTAAPDSPGKTAARRDMIHLTQDGHFDEVAERLMSVFLFRHHCADSVRAMLYRNKAAFISQESAMLARKDCLSIPGKITCPTLIIHADQDAVFSLRDSRTLHAGIHGARLARIQHCGHMSPMEAPEEVTALMQAWMNDEHFPMME